MESQPTGVNVLDFVTDASPTSGPDTTVTDGSENATSTEEDTRTYRNVVASLKAADVTAGENPVYDGNPTMTVSEFAAYLTVANVSAKISAGETPGLDEMVDRQKLYNAVKGVRSPLPVVLVFPDDSADDKDAAVYLPVALAEKAWNERPSRGETSPATSSKRSDDELIEDAAKKYQSLTSAQARLAKLTEKVATLNTQYDKYLNYLKARNLDQTSVDAKVKELNEAAEVAEENAAGQNENTPAE